MSQYNQNRAAELHQLAAHAHEVAATAHGKGDHLTAHELSRLAHEHSSHVHRYIQELRKQSAKDKAAAKR